jgi:hypothetical protein
MLNCDASLEPNLKQHGKKLGPVDQALAGNSVAPPTVAMNSHFLQDRLDDLGIFGVDPADSVAKIPGCLDRVNELPNKVRRIELETVSVVWNQSQQLFPERRYSFSQAGR